MNWTGGNLHRHSKKSSHNAIVEKQKAHFSKVRTALQDGPAHAATRPRIFGEASDDGRGYHNNQALSALRGARTQSRLDSFDDFAPVVDSLSSMSSRTVRAGNTRSPGRKALSLQAKPNEEQVSPQSRIPPPLESNTVSKHFKLPSSNDKVSTEDMLERQRQMLLSNSDWIGLKSANILHMDFISDKGKENFGKRRKIEKADPPDDEHARRVYIPSVRDYPARNGGSEMRDIAPSESIQIRIGDDALTSRMSVSQRVQTPSRGVSSQAGSPDSMLLDDHAQEQSQLRMESLVRSTRPRHDTPHSESPLARKTPYSRDAFIEATDEDYEKAPGPSSLYESVRSMIDDRDVDGHASSEHEINLAAATAASLHKDRDDVFTVVENTDAGTPTLAHTQDPASRFESLASPSANDSNSLSGHFEVPSVPGHGNIVPNSASKPTLQAPTAQIYSKSKPTTTAYPMLSARSPGKGGKSSTTSESAMPPTPASLKALEALCQAKPKPPARQAAPTRKAKPTPALDPDAAWKAFVFGGVQNTLADDEDEEAPLPLFLTRTKRPPTSSLDVAPPTPARQRKQRSSSILTSIPSERDQVDTKTTAATVASSSSSAFQSDGRASPVKKIEICTGTAVQHSSLASNSDVFDRPSSIANASIMPGMLRTEKPVMRQRMSSPDPLAVGHEVKILHRQHAQRHHKQSGVIFNRPTPFGAARVQGQARDEHEHEDIVYIGEGGRARELIRDAGSEAGEIEGIEDVE